MRGLVKWRLLFGISVFVTLGLGFGVWYELDRQYTKFDSVVSQLKTLYEIVNENAEKAETEISTIEFRIEDIQFEMDKLALTKDPASLKEFSEISKGVQNETVIPTVLPEFRLMDDLGNSTQDTLTDSFSMDKLFVSGGDGWAIKHMRVTLIRGNQPVSEIDCRSETFTIYSLHKPGDRLLIEIKTVARTMPDGHLRIMQANKKLVIYVQSVRGVN